MTTLAPFVPLLFWKGIIGKFMFFLPVTLIVTLLASLLVAYIINPVFAVDFMKPHAHGESHKKVTRGYIITMIIFVVIALMGYASGSFGFGNFVIVLSLLYSLNKFVPDRCHSAFFRMISGQVFRINMKKYWSGV